VGTIDILPTVLELAGVAVDERHPIEGRSLLQTAPDGSRGRGIYSEGMLYGSTQRSLISGHYKLIQDQAGGAKLYQLENDPDELVDLAAQQPERVRQLEAELAALRRRVADTRLVDGRSPEAGDAERERVREALRALGYSE
jgi:choline-sulfatase